MILKNLRQPSWTVLSALIMGLSLAACQGEAAPNKTIYSAQSIITIDADNPVATAVVIGIQNSGLGIVILLKFLAGLGGAGVVAGLWGTWHIIAGLILVGLFRWRDRLA